MPRSWPHICSGSLPTIAVSTGRQPSPQRQFSRHLPTAAKICFQTPSSRSQRPERGKFGRQIGELVPQASLERTLQQHPHPHVQIATTRRAIRSRRPCPLSGERSQGIEIGCGSMLVPMACRTKPDPATPVFRLPVAAP
jgi:hypothetical protein